MAAMARTRPGTWKPDGGDGYFGSPLQGLSDKIRHHAVEFSERALFAKARNSWRKARQGLLGSPLQRA